MWAKLRVETGGCCSVRGIVILLLAAFCASRICLADFIGFYPEGCFGEYIVYVLDDYYFILLLFPVLFLLLMTGRHQEIYRYPVLVRYQNRNEFFYVRFVARVCFVVMFLASFMALLLLAGRDLPSSSAQAFIKADAARVIPRQLMNIFCFLCVMVLFHEFLSGIIGNAVIDLCLTAALPLVNLVLVKLCMTRIELWTPWGCIGYLLDGHERSGYQFYWWYWLFAFVLLFYAADERNGRKDYVFERDRKAQ